MDILKTTSLNVKDLSFINNIKSIAVIGPSKKRDYFFLRNHVENFKGNVYAIHPSKEIRGARHEQFRRYKRRQKSP